MPETILITGGAGFIGRYVARALLERGHRVRVLDSLIEQVHGDAARARRLDRDVEMVVGDVRDEAAVAKALKGVDKVVHLAAEVGVGQSMYAVDRYVSVNDLGTAVLFQQLIERRVQAGRRGLLHEHLRRGPLPHRRRRAGRGRGPPAPRSAPRPPGTRSTRKGRPLVPVPTPEWKRPALASVYASPSTCRSA